MCCGLWRSYEVRGPQFKAARDFLDQLPRPQIVVPEITTFRCNIFCSALFARSTSIDSTLQTTCIRSMSDEEIAVFASTPPIVDDQRWSHHETQVGGREKLCSVGPDVTKIGHASSLRCARGYDERSGREGADGNWELVRVGRICFRGHLHVSHTGHTQNGTTSAALIVGCAGRHRFFHAR